MSSLFSILSMFPVDGILTVGFIATWGAYEYFSANKQQLIATRKEKECRKLQTEKQLNEFKQKEKVNSNIFK